MLLLSLVMTAICPHPPLIIPAIGKGEEKVVSKTKEAILEVGKKILQSGAKTLVWITPHGPVFGDGIAFNIEEEVLGNFDNFGIDNLNFSVKTNVPLTDLIAQKAENKGIVTARLNKKKANVYGVNVDLDHGIMVPNYFFKEALVDLPVVIIYMGLLAYETLYNFGIALQEALEEVDEKVAIVASGDLSHRLIPHTPAGYSPKGKIFDQKVKEGLERLDIEGLLEMDKRSIEEAGECGFRPLLMMLGALEGKKVKGNVLAYEAPFGVGYLTSYFECLGEDEDRKYYPKILASKREENLKRMAKEGFLPALARKSLEYYLKENQQFKINTEDVPKEFSRKAGVFVSLKKDGQLRGCIGNINPYKENIVLEVIQNAVNAGVNDHRFYPVKLEELDDLEISVDVLSEPESIKGLKDLDPKRYGVIVSSDGKSGLLLPDLDGINSPEQQVEIARKKAGIASKEKVSLERFLVMRYY